MANSLRERLAELEQKQGAAPESTPPPAEELMAIPDVSGRSQPSSVHPLVGLAQSANQGMVNMIGNPGNVQEGLRNIGVLPAQEIEGILPRAAEIFGGALPAALGGGAIGANLISRATPLANKLGTQVVLPNLERLGIFKNFFAGMARHPLRGESVGSLGAGAGGEVVSQVTDDETAQLLGEQAGGIAASISPTVLATRAVTKHGPGLMKYFNNRVRASEELRGQFADPDAARGNIDTTSPVSPARQTGDPRAIALEEKIIRDAPPAEAAAMRKQREVALGDAQQKATDFGGDTDAPRQIIESQGRQTVRRQMARAEQAVNETEDALKSVDVGVDAPDVSRAGKDKIITAMKAGRAAESEAWSKVDQEMPRTLDNLRTTVDDITAETGVFNRAEAIPAKIRQALEYDGDIVFRDVHGLRQNVQDEIRNEINQQAPSWGKIRQLRKLESALLEDMSAGDNEPLNKAREISRQFNERFTSGKMGQLLGERAGVDRVPDADTFSNVLSGQFAARDMEQILSAAPEAKPEAMDFIRAQFYSAAVKDGRVAQADANRYIATLRKKRIFEVFPELEAELTNATSKAARADTLVKRAELVKKRGGARLEQQSKESLASLYADAPIGQEADVLIDADPQRVVRLANKLRSRMSGNDAAEHGLRSAFAERLFRRSAKGATDSMGEPIYSGSEYTRLLKENEPTLQALGFSDPQIQQMRRSATIMRQVEADPSGDTIKRLMNDPKGYLLNLIAAYAGARTASNINRAAGGAGAGVSLQAATRGASGFERFAKFLSRDKAAELLVAAHKDPDMYKAFLVRPGDAPDKLKRAETLLNAWAASSVAEKFSEDDDLD